MSQHIGPRTISAIGGSIKRVGPYRIHTFPSELVTDGLVLNLDAGDPRSLDPANTGLTTWTDLSGNGNNGTLGSSTAAPTYSNADGGKLVFDGSNDYVSIPGSGSLGQLTREITIETWSYFNGTPGSAFNELIRRENSGSRILLSYQNQNVLAFGLQWDNGAQYDELDVGINPSDYANQWVCIQATYDGYTKKLYRNGVLIGAEDTYQGNFPTSSTDFYIGSSQGASEFFPGNISIVRIYNKCLSAAEVAQNYDALRVRYGSYTSTFTPICAGGEGKVEVLCVAGGGGGGADHGGGGGGAGGLIYNSAFSINSNTGIGVTIGSGGGQQTNGGNTTFSSLTSIGGGRGGGENAPVDGQSGGSGGGGSGRPIATTGGSGTSGQGFAGGRGGYPNADNAIYGNGGGGGGAGGPGTDGKEGFNIGFGAAGNGGPGLSYSISGESKFYAGGGGGGYWGTAFAGGLGGSGVGGKGGDGGGDPGGYKGRNGIPNTGSGGGGSSGSGFPRNGGNGANGTVIVRYPATDYNVEVLVVGGGGGGGGSADGGAGGGGGAGGHVYYSSYAVSSGKKINVSVGKGGNSGGYNTNSPGENGGNSIFDISLVAFGGGGGGPGYNGTTPFTLYDGKNGASGGGAGSNGTQRPGGIGILGQGNDGGFGADGTGFDGAGGGGGAGTAGGNGGAGTANSFGGDGGDGVAYSITGTSTYYCGGGGGGGSAGQGTGGLGGGGSVNTNGSSNTGGGGGGGADQTSNHNGGNGGSGIVIIAYKGPQRGIGGTVDTTSRPGYTLHKFTTVGTDFFIP